MKSLNEHGFDVLIAVDKNMPFQQSVISLEVVILVLDVKRNILPELLLLKDSIRIFLETNPDNDFHLISG